MKSIICLLITLLWVIRAGAQPLDLSSISRLPPQQQEEAMLYWQQAKTAKMSGWGFCIGGAVLATLGSLMVVEGDKQYGSNFNEDESMVQAGTALVFAGAATVGFSIRLFRKGRSSRENVKYMLRQNNKSFIAPKFSPVNQTAGIKLVIPI